MKFSCFSCQASKQYSLYCKIVFFEIVSSCWLLVLARVLVINMAGNMDIPNIWMVIWYRIRLYIEQWNTSFSLFTVDSCHTCHSLTPLSFSLVMARSISVVSCQIFILISPDVSGDILVLASSRRRRFCRKHLVNAITQKLICRISWNFSGL